jgi:hypothetical protein
MQIGLPYLQLVPLDAMPTHSKPISIYLIDKQSLVYTVLTITFLLICSIIRFILIIRYLGPGYGAHVLGLQKPGCLFTVRVYDI